MADLKLNGITPDGVGKIKLGSVDVQEIYMGSTLVWPPVGPGEIEICNYIWTQENSIETELAAGGNIPIVSDFASFKLLNDASQPCAMYYNFDSNNSSYGLLYNSFAKNAIKVPAGFRIPTPNDWGDIGLFCNPTLDTYKVNWLGANPGEWAPNPANKTTLGDSGLDIQGYGYAFYDATSITWEPIGESEGHWQGVTDAGTAIAWIPSLNPSFLLSTSSGFNVVNYLRFVKDA